jgi:formate-dependent nitrite reductase cytochrome c552 subunit
MNSRILQGKWKLWAVWSLFAAGLSAWLAYTLVSGEDKRLLMPGPLSPGHHQLALACDACHTDALGGGEVLQQACVDCHGEDRKKPFDSHPRAKFTDPRNADRLEHINALACVSCHVEHRPEITAKDGLTQPLDVCVHCHAEIGEERPSHAGMSFLTCKDAGCHNFHNNRALYTDFLVKHLGEPALLEQRQLPQREFGQVLDEIMEYPRDRYPVEPLDAAAMDAPEAVEADEAVRTDWLETAHAAAGVNCSACHLQPAAEDESRQWTDHPDEQGCAQCHDLEIQRFQQGKHGMRLAVGLPPMTPAEARLPMQDDAAHRALTCNSCHPAHRFEVQQAAVEACLECHADNHSLAFKDSPHYALWEQEQAGDLPVGSGVSCASCHMPRIDFDVSDWLSRIMVDHNQSANLSPNSKMIRSACLHCHGLEYTLNALADPRLIENNFNGPPTARVESMRLAEADHRRALEETAAAREDAL